MVCNHDINHDIDHDSNHDIKCQLINDIKCQLIMTLIITLNLDDAVACWEGKQNNTI